MTNPEINNMVNNYMPLLLQAGLEPAITQGCDDQQKGMVIGLMFHIASDHPTLLHHSPSVPESPSPPPNPCKETPRTASKPPDPMHRPLHLRGGSPTKPPETGSIVLAALNVKGANSSATWDKWKGIIHSMLSKRIAILCVLESHSDDNQINKLNTKYGPNLHFTHSHDVHNHRSKGIVIVTNKNKTNSIPTNLISINPGRALSFEINWPESKKNQCSSNIHPKCPQ